MKAIKKEELLYKIDDILRSKTTGEYHSHTFADTLYITEKTYKNAVRKQRLKYYFPDTGHTSHEIIQIYISSGGVSVSTYTYYLPAPELSRQELEAVWILMRKECFE